MFTEWRLTPQCSVLNAQLLLSPEVRSPFVVMLKGLLKPPGYLIP